MTCGKPRFAFTFAAALLGLTLLLPPWKSVSGGEINIGTFYSCSNGLKGSVIIVNERLVEIRGFSYDGKTPGAYLLAMHKGSRGVNTLEGFHTLPYYNPAHDIDCEALPEHNNANITITLPFDWTLYETIGVYDHSTCTNIGHVRIPENIKPDPMGGIRINCNRPDYPVCYPDKSKYGELTPSCPVA